MDLGDIYLIQNKINKKCYVGQAVKYSRKRKWGYTKRYKSHLSEAFGSGKDHCRLLNNALRKYKIDNFELSLIGEYKLEKLNEMEKHFITEYNSLVPNGYNLNSGGYSGKDSAETRLKKRLMRLGKKNSNSHIENSRLGQIGNRRTTKKLRKYPEDNDLPKYIAGHRIHGKLIGYKVYKFPIGINEKKYISSLFCSKKITLKENLQLAIEYLTELEKKYSDLQKHIKTAHNSRREKRVTC